ncbi:MAG: U32 family peptidase [Oligoflexia bacterium]|nr:U32 family peptidase [Oligoflexia bacterium]
MAVLCNMKKTEILSPAGNLEKLRFAYAYGADAAYAGMPFFSLRARRNDFGMQELTMGYELARQLHKKLYITANIFARNRKIERFINIIDEWASLNPDALIMSDPGLIMIVRDRHPNIPIHLSVQANCMNWQSVKFWHKQGIQRIILSRELLLEEIRQIQEKVPEVELEAFVHGAICIAYSGRCLMSSYMSYRDANQGACDNSCREKFNLYSCAPDKQNDIYIEDRRTPGDFYRIDEDENGTYIMSAKDLNLIEHIKEIIDSGVCSLKIEGRTKSIYYVSMVTRAYRKALDRIENGLEFDSSVVEDLQKIANRGYHKGFLLGAPGVLGQNYSTSNNLQYSNRRFSAVVRVENKRYSGYLPVEVRGQIKVGDQCELISPTETKTFTLTNIKNNLGLDVSTVNPGGVDSTFHILVDTKPEAYSFITVMS